MRAGIDDKALQQVAWGDTAQALKDLVTKMWYSDTLVDILRLDRVRVYITLLAPVDLRIIHRGSIPMVPCILYRMVLAGRHQTDGVRGECRMHW